MEKEEIMELSHEPKPGYKIVYYAVIAIGILYLAITLAIGKMEQINNKSNHPSSAVLQSEDTKTQSHKEH